MCYVTFSHVTAFEVCVYLVACGSHVVLLMLFLYVKPQLNSLILKLTLKEIMIFGKQNLPLIIGQSMGGCVHGCKERWDYICKISFASFSFFSII